MISLNCVGDEAGVTGKTVEAEDSSSVADAYIDQLIDPAAENELEDPVYRSLMEQPAGRRYRSLEFRYYQEDLDSAGRSAETGLHLDLRRETYNYGELELEGALLGVDSVNGRLNDSSGGVLFTLRQHDFALDDQWLMQNSLGIDRSYTDPLLANSFRFKLPSSLYSGAGSRISSERTHISVGVGRLGRFDSGQFETFDPTGGTLAQASVSHDFREHWRAGMALVNVTGADVAVDHQSVAGVVEYDRPDLRQRLQGHLVTDSEGSAGIWMDGDLYLGRWRQLFGIYRLDPGLLWTDVPMANDQQGFYLRSELRTLRYQISGGMELSTTDVDNLASVDGSRLASVYVTANRQLQLNQSIGGTLALRDTRSMDTPAIDDDSRNASIAVYGARQFRRGTTRLQLQLANITNGPDHGHATGITLDQSWDASNLLTLSGTLAYETERDTGNDADRFTAGLLAYHNLSSDLRWDAAVNWTRVDNAVTGLVNDNINGGLGFNWNFKPGWEANLRARVTDVSADAGGMISSAPTTDHERSILLSVRNVTTGGRPFERLGRDTGKTGYGTVSGEVFYDTNRDGIRQPGEAVASGVYVYLDRRYQQITDRDGRFEFYPVLAGDHSVSLALEDIPLPWTLDEDRPVTASVSVRSRTRISFPLVRYDE